MTALMNHWNQARALALRAQRAFDGRVRRERLLLIGAAIAMAWMAADGLWLTPAFKDWSAARARQAGARAALQQVNDEIARRDADARAAGQQLRGELAQWRERVARGDAALQAFGGTLVGAAEMVPVLDQLLAQTGGLQLRSMQSLGSSVVGAAPAQGATQGSLQATQGTQATPAAPNFQAAAQAANATEPKPSGVLYRHGVELTVEGSYAEVLAYLRAIEAMPQRVLWGGMQLRVEQHPKVIVSLQLFTLSQDRTWLEI